MNEPKVVKLDKFKPRPYQLAVCDALENKSYKKICLVWGRRSGKDLVAFNLMIRAAIRKTGVYFYMLPTFSQARKVIWDSITNDGVRFIDFIPKDIVKATNSQELKITLVNGSVIQLLGSDNYDAIVGTNPIFIVLSEFALADPRALELFRPILNANNGTLIIVSTPRGKNTFHDIYQTALKSKEWFCQKLSVEDTRHIPLERIEKDIEEGLVSPDLVQQEYYCSFEQGAEGSYYAKYIQDMRLQDRIGSFQWNPNYPVSTAWDLGVTDSTCILFFQRINGKTYIIDSFEKNKEGLEFYAKYIFSKPYQYDKHWGPHDLAVKEFGSGLTRIEKARQLGIKFETRDSGTKSGLPAVSLVDGIESVRSSFVNMFINEVTCKDFIKSIENYRQEWDGKRQVYNNKPLHNKDSHYADCLRYLCLSFSRYKDEKTTPEELDRRYQEALRGYDDGLGSASGFFQSNDRGF